MKFLVFIFCFSFQLAYGQISVKYREATAKNIELTTFHSELNKESSEKIKLAYESAYFVLMASQEKAVLKKKDWFIKGATQLDSLIEQYPKDVELKWIRLTIQDNAPSFLKYNTSINTDLTFIETHINEVSNSTLKKTIQNYLGGRKK